MNVLFAVNNEDISNSIVKMYRKQYKEIITYKNVYYWDSIIKELQKNKSYDRIVISEDVQALLNKSYDTIDKYIFEKLDKITDEGNDAAGNDTPIILICTDRRVKSDSFFIKIFGIGIYSALIGQDRTQEKVCELINKPRSKREAKNYYKIESEDVNYQNEKENTVNEVELVNILDHYKKLGKNEEKYVESFNNIAEQYNDEQLKLIIRVLPLNVKIVLESKCEKYQSLMTYGQNTTGRILQEKKQNENRISVDYIEGANNGSQTSKEVVVPSEVNTKQVKRRVKEEKEEIQTRKVIEPVRNTVKPEIEITEEPVKKRRGRPKKVVEVQQEEVLKPELEVLEEPVKKRRGRPKKIVETQPEEQIELPLPDDIDEAILPGFDDEPEETLPGFDDSEDDMENDVLPGFDDEDYDDDSEEGILPGFNDEDEGEDNLDNILPGFDDDDDEGIQNSNYTGLSQYNDILDNRSYSDVTENEEKSIKNTHQEESIDLDRLLAQDKKVVAFVGTTKNGTSFLINNLAELTSANGIKTAILDMTKNKNAYYIYTKNEENLRQIAYESIEGLKSGVSKGIDTNKNLTVFTTIPMREEFSETDVKNMIATLVKEYDLVLIDCDFDSPKEIMKNVQEIYLVQSMDILTIQPLTTYLRDLKAKNLLSQEKLRIVINKMRKIRGLNEKTIIGGMSTYNDPPMSNQDKLFNKDSIKYTTVRFEEQNYARYMEAIVDSNDIPLKSYTKNLMIDLKKLRDMVYPLLNGKGRNKNYGFSSNMNSTLERMKKKY